MKLSVLCDPVRFTSQTFKKRTYWPAVMARDSKQNLASSGKALEASAFCFFEGKIPSVNNQNSTFRLLHVLVVKVQILFILLQAGKQQIDVSVSCVCPVIDNEFRHNIVKVAVDPRGDSRVVPHSHLFFSLTNCQNVRSRTLPHRIN